MINREDGHVLHSTILKRNDENDPHVIYQTFLYENILATFPAAANGLRFHEMNFHENGLLKTLEITIVYEENKIQYGALHSDGKYLVSTVKRPRSTKGEIVVWDFKTREKQNYFVNPLGTMGWQKM